MRAEGNKELLKAYLRAKRRPICLFFLCGLIYVVVYALYHVSLEPALYAGLLAGSAGVAYLWVDFTRFGRRHFQLQVMEKQCAVHPPVLFPPEDLLEEDYQRMVAFLAQARSRLTGQWDKEREEAASYYTLWAHQIKTPISAMDLLLQEGEASPAALEQELLRIRQYVEMVLQYQRLAGIHHDLSLKRYSLEDLVRQAVKKTAVLFIHGHVSLEVAPFHAMVLTDEKWLVFVLEQLLTNAVKYTPEGRVTISLPDPEKAVLTIRDSGMGIQAEDLPRVFEKGFTGYNGRVDKKSTGIGLYLCKQVMDTLGHGLSIQSRMGEGTCVTLDLRRRELKVE